MPSFKAHFINFLNLGEVLLTQRADGEVSHGGKV